MTHNPLHSMTGFALARRDTPVGSAILEIRSVNSRFLDLQFRISDELRGAEGIVRDTLTAGLTRGKLDCRFYLQRNAPGSSGLQINQQLVDQLARLDDTVRAHSSRAASLSVHEILRWPGVLEDRELSGDVLTQMGKDLARDALSQLAESRAREGAKLKTMLIERIEAMEAIVLRLQPLVPQLVATHQQKLTERLQNALMAAVGDPAAGITHNLAEFGDRVRQEVTLFGVRIDIAEELTRLSAHLAETRHILELGGAAGKRLDFMMQELNREANTVGSKAAAAEFADAAMALKLLIEQMREQVQNLE